jgi:prepilin-type N-terminal cleavage/methylation domain-containing protein
METQPMGRHDHSRVRPGFTALELLVVLAIITILIALTSAAVLKFINLQQRYNTVTALNLMQTKANTQWQNVTDKAMSDNSLQENNWVQNWQNNNPGQPPTLARALYVQTLQVQAFPVTFKEALTPDPTGVIPAWPAYQAFLNNLGITAATVSATPAGPNEASVCLLMALTIGPYNTGATAESFGSAYVTNLLVATTKLPPPADKVFAQGIIDGWGTPVGLNRGTSNLTITSAGQDRILGTPDDIASNALPQVQ